MLRCASTILWNKFSFSTLQDLLDYEVDSDDEWEEEEPGESLSNSEVQIMINIMFSQIEKLKIPFAHVWYIIKILMSGVFSFVPQTPRFLCLVILIRDLYKENKLKYRSLLNFDIIINVGYWNLKALKFSTTGRSWNLF